jgi:hypothetical protein
MSKIDWSNGPEGATHFLPAKNGSHTDIFILMDGVTVKNVGYPSCDNWAHTYTADSQPSIDLGRAISKRDDAKEWIGEGLPPVGTVCEHRTGHGMNWSTATVLAFGEKKVFYRDRDGHEWTRLYDEIEFRPIRTPEQIAAEKVSKQLDSDLAMYGTSFALTNDDGSITRLDPTKIVMRKQEAK